MGDSSLTTAEGRHNLKYISIPLVLKYTRKFGKIPLSPGAGLTANYLAGASIRTEIKDGIRREEVKLTRIQGIKKFYAGLIVNASVSYNVTGSFGISLLPSFNYAVMPITNKNVVKTYPFSAGLGIGIYIHPVL